MTISTKTIPSPTKPKRSPRSYMPIPILIFLAIITQIPFVATIYHSFRNWNLLRPGNISWVGFQNYIRTFENGDFYTVVWNTIFFTISVVVLTFVLGMFFAILLNRPFWGQGFARTLLISPFLVMPVVTAVLWKNVLFNPAFGLFTYVLNLVGLERIDWLATHPMGSIIAVVTWQWTPFVMLILLAGLQSLPPSLLEAAQIDGARNLDLFRYIILPHLKQFIEIALLLETIFVLNTFGTIFVVTTGGPGLATTNLPFEIYKEAFLRWNISKASALGVLAVILANVVTLLFVRIINSQEQGSATT